MEASAAQLGTLLLVDHERRGWNAEGAVKGHSTHRGGCGKQQKSRVHENLSHIAAVPAKLRSEHLSRARHPSQRWTASAWTRVLGVSATVILILVMSTERWHGRFRRNACFLQLHELAH